jgi:hypothetical protein
MWQLRDDDVKRDFDQAIAHCASLRLGGHPDWRLPTIDEFGTLRQSAAASRLIVSITHGESGDPYWTITPGPSSDVAHLADGSMIHRDQRFPVRGVRQAMGSGGRVIEQTIEDVRASVAKDTSTVQSAVVQNSAVNQSQVVSRPATQTERLIPDALLIIVGVVCGVTGLALIGRVTLMVVSYFLLSACCALVGVIVLHRVNVNHSAIEQRLAVLLLPWSALFFLGFFVLMWLDDYRTHRAYLRLKRQEQARLGPMLRCLACGHHQQKYAWHDSMDKKAVSMGMRGFINLGALPKCLMCGSTELR